jgi:hypothetical protein
MSTPSKKPLDWRENLALLVEYTRRQALACEQIAASLRDANDIAKLGQQAEAGLKAQLQALAIGMAGER